MDLLNAMPLIQLFLDILLYLAIFVHFLSKKGLDEKIKFAFIVVVALVIIYGLNLDFILRSTILISFLAFMGLRLIISRVTIIILLIIFLVLPTREFFPLFVVAMVFYTVTMLGFIFSAINLLIKGETPPPIGADRLGEMLRKRF